MGRRRKEEAFVKFKSQDVIHSAQALIAASGILVAVTDQYTHTGQLSVGAVLHATSVIDEVIDRLKLTEVAIEQSLLPF